MNYFLFAAGILMFGGAVFEMSRTNYALASIYFSYATANFVLAGIGGK
jgi:hypothetical protein